MYTTVRQTDQQLRRDIHANRAQETESNSTTNQIRSIKLESKAEDNDESEEDDDDDDESTKTQDRKL